MWAAEFCPSFYIFNMSTVFSQDSDFKAPNTGLISPIKVFQVKDLNFITDTKCLNSIAVFSYKLIYITHFHIYVTKW